MATERGIALCRAARTGSGGSSRPLLVGEANPHGSDPQYALFPDPRGCAGWRLCHLVLGLDECEYLRRYERVNLCPTEWSAGAARSEADRLLSGTDSRTFVLLGAKVARAFLGTSAPFTWIPAAWRRGGAMHAFVTLPHPSGLSRAWNVPGAYDRAREVMRGAGALW